MGIATMTVLSDILLENNRQRMNLFGLANKAKDVNVIIIDFIAAAREGGIDIQDFKSLNQPSGKFFATLIQRLSTVFAN